MTVHTAEESKQMVNLYHFNQHAGEGVISAICTNNAYNLGCNPVLITDKESVPMSFDGKYYSAAIKYPAHKYRIYYKDTDKYENGGESVNLDKHKISRGVLIQDLINNNKPLQKDISKGYAQGKVVTDKNNIPKDTEVILILGDTGEGDELAELPSNVQAVICSDGKIDYLSHIAALSRSYFNLFTILYDEKKYAELKKLNGEYIYISNLGGGLKYHKAQKLFTSKINGIVNVPKLSEDSELLDYNQLNKNNSGLKAYRVAQISSLSDSSYLNDVIIPKGFILSSGYINDIEKYLNQAATQEDREDMLFDNPFLKELKTKCENAGILPENAIIRSAFNAEDLFDYPTAGLYDSECCYGINDFVLIIDNIFASKDSVKAKESRKRYGISDDAIQLSVIIQEYIITDYTFTLYTDLKNKKVLIELISSKYANMNLEPASVVYNDADESLNIKKYQIYNNAFVIDDKGKIIKKTEGHNPIAENWTDLSPLLIKVSKNALKLEEAFGKQQDIEGGLKNDKIYFWQTRDIPKYALSHL